MFEKKERIKWDGFVTDPPKHWNIFVSLTKDFGKNRKWNAWGTNAINWPVNMCYGKHSGLDLMQILGRVLFWKGLWAGCMVTLTNMGESCIHTYILEHGFTY